MAKVRVKASNIKKKLDSVKSNPPKDFQLIKAIRGQDQKDISGESVLYRANIQRRDALVRKYVDENLSTRNKQTIIPGQLIMFNYFEPKTKDELEYYDAMPCTIFFGTFKSKDGLRVIGFNLHYYPPKIRYQVLDRIFDIYKPFYLKNWDKSLKSEIKFFDYEMFMYQLQEHGLEFGVRQYIPELMHKITPIPPKDWQKAVFTEGRFKKRTREQIMKYWTNKLTQSSTNNKKKTSK